MYKKVGEIVGHSGAIYTSLFDNQFLYTGSADNFVTRWDLKTQKQDKFAIKMNQSVYAIEFIEYNKLVVGLSNGSVHVFDLLLKKEIKHFTQHIKAVFAISSNLNKSQFYVGDADGNLSVWNSKTLELIIYLPLNAGKIRNIHVSTNGEMFILSCQDGTTRIFETLGFNEIVTLNSHKNGATVAFFHPVYSDIILTSGKDAHIKIWNWRESELIKNIPAHNYVVYDICFIDNNSKFITVSRDKTIKIWDATNFNFLERLDVKVGGHKHSVNKVSKINEHSFVSVGDDKKIILWDAHDEIHLN